MAKTYIQVRAEEQDKRMASNILDELGTNLSSVINMLLKQIIITKGIPFDVKLSQPYTQDEIISEVKATMGMENMQLTKEDEKLLRKYQSKASDAETIRKAVITEYQEEA